MPYYLFKFYRLMNNTRNINTLNDRCCSLSPPFKIVWKCFVFFHYKYNIAIRKLFIKWYCQIKKMSSRLKRYPAVWSCDTKRNIVESLYFLVTNAFGALKYRLKYLNIVFFDLTISLQLVICLLIG